VKLALIGTGAMGSLVAQRAAAAGHEVVGRFNRHEPATVEGLTAANAVIDFSVADAVVENVRLAVAARRAIVVGATGWNDRLSEVTAIVKSGGGALVYGANFSIGVNIFYKLVEQAAASLAATGYEPFIEEQHHARKKDAPSGTAIALRDIVKRAAARVDVPVAATRAGHITGTHRVGFDGAVDQILLIHQAKSRDGFADGALFAAEWIAGRKGVYEFAAAVDEMIQSRNHG
jgi:4-hydroxy-tetrahydrodipicolinate reductase